jgi:hypothetical protein
MRTTDMRGKGLPTPAGSTESLRLGLCGFPLWHFSVGALITEELFNVRSRGVAEAAALSYLLCKSSPWTEAGRPPGVMALAK